MNRWLFLTVLLVLPAFVFAQDDDDMYFTPRKKQQTQRPTHVGQGTVTIVAENPTIEVYNHNSRDDDEYNRRTAGYDGSYQTEGGYDEAEETLDEADRNDEDYYYSRRILRFRSPRVGIAISSPYYWDLVYSWGAYDYLYDPYYYDPFFWHYGWGYGWSWGPWSSWYGPFWGWHHPYHWSYWGWGPGWHHHYGGWYGGWGGHYNRYQHGAYNRFDAASRIRTGSLANGGRTFNATRSGSAITDRSGRTSIQHSMNETRSVARNSINQRGVTRSTSVDNTRRVSEYNTRSRTTSSYDRSRSVGRSDQNYSRPSSTRSTGTVQNRSVSTPSRSSGYSGSTRSSGYSGGATRGGGSYGGGSRGGGFGGGGFGGRRTPMNVSEK